MKSDKIYLVGFMGAGKTTMGRRLARKLGWTLEDLDERIEEREHRTIASIFRDRGEPYFRAVERDVLMALIPARDTVVATGGGTFVDPENRAVMLADGMVVWLDVALDTVIARVPADGRRPLAGDRATLAALYEARRAAYQLAHLRVDVSGARPEAVVERVLDRLGW